MMHLACLCRNRVSLLVLVGVLVMLPADGCDRPDTTARSGIGPGRPDNPGTVIARTATVAETSPPSLADGPLLLLDDMEGSESASGPAADNSRCFVCHINYAQELIATTHARANIGCARCHGPSDAHIADESWGSGGNGTAPDIMYPRDKINPGCMACHPRDKIDAPHPEPAFADSDAKVCTDCHGDHRLSQRRCRWR